MLQHSYQIRIVQRQQRPGFKLPEEDSHKNPPQPDCYEPVRPVKLRAALFKRWHQEPVQVDNAHDKQQPSHIFQILLAMRHKALKKQKEWDREVKNHQAECHCGPTRVNTRNVPRYLILQVSSPNNQELIKRKI